MLSQYSWDNIAQVNSMCNVVQDTSDNIAKEKLLLNFVLILLEQHCAGKILVARFGKHILRGTSFLDPEVSGKGYVR